MEVSTIKTEFIKLDQFLKWAGLTDSGAESKVVIADGKVKVNGTLEMQRGKKLRPGDIVEIGSKSYKIENE